MESFWEDPAEMDELEEEDLEDTLSDSNADGSVWVHFNVRKKITITKVVHPKLFLKSQIGMI